MRCWRLGEGKGGMGEGKGGISGAATAGRHLAHRECPRTTFPRKGCVPLSSPQRGSWLRAELSLDPVSGLRTVPPSEI